MKKERVDTAIPKAVLNAADTVFRLFLSGRVAESRVKRRSLIRHIRSRLNAKPEHIRLWCMLGELYTHRKWRLECYRTALRRNPLDAESNAEIARLYAEANDRRYKEHFDRALNSCRGVDIEDSIIYAALEAARVAGDAQRQRRALKLARRRFPDCSLFQ